MTDLYPVRIRENILPLSIAGTLPEAFKEWFFTEKIHDHEAPEAQCELCGQEDLRYEFQIKNRHTLKELWVGSKCILKFRLAVYENGKILDSEGAEKKLNALTKKMQLESCVKALEELSKKEKNDLLKNALNFYKINKYLTPKYAFVVFWRLKENHIDFHPSFFKISLKKDKYKKDLKEMPSSRVHYFWAALTSSQRKIAQDLGHKPPASIGG